MKTKLKVLVYRVKNLLKNKRDLDNNGKIESYRQEAEGLFFNFRNTVLGLETLSAKHEEVIRDELENQLAEHEAVQTVIANSNKRIEASQKLVEEAEKEKERNEKIKSKIEDLIS